MKVGILTLALHSNFGYLMQAYALQQMVRKLGHEPYTYQLWNTIPNRRKRFISFVKGFILKYILRKISGSIITKYNTAHEQAIIDHHTRRFIENNFQLSPYLKDIKDIKKLRNEYDACIVGSDQVWRRWYAPRIQSYYFDFLPSSVRRTSYAASFGLPYIQYSKLQKKECGKALKFFSGISVRETEGMDICKREWGENAACVIDPTLLLGKDEYIKLIDPNETLGIPNADFLLCYILDETTEKTSFIEEFANGKGLSVFKIKPDMYDSKKDIHDCIYPPISMWLEAFNRASYVITDSFHGTAFSIIFKKQFLSIGNVQRGISRFVSLLGELNLSDRLIIDLSNNVKDMRDLDYADTDKLLGRKVDEGIAYLNAFLNDEK